MFSMILFQNPRKLQICFIRLPNHVKYSGPKRQIAQSSVITRKNLNFRFINAEMQLHCLAETSHWDRHQFLHGPLGTPVLLWCHVFNI